MSQLHKVERHASDSILVNKTVNLEVPRYGTVDHIFLEFLNNGNPATKANILNAVGKVLLTINGDTVINADIAHLYDIYRHLGTEVTHTAVPDNVIDLNLSPLFFKNPVMEKLFAFGCQNIDSFQIQLFCKGTVTGVTDVQLSTERRPFTSATSSYLKVIDYPQNKTSAGIAVVDDLPKDSNDAYLLCAAYNGGGALATGEAILDGVSIIQKSSTNLLSYVAAKRGYTPITNAMIYNFTDGTQAGVVPMRGVREFQFKNEFSEAPTNGTYDFLTVSIKNLPEIMYNAATA